MGRDSEKWKEEKERLAKATLEKRREGYSCGANSQSLEEIPALNETPAPHLSEAKRERIERELLKDFVLESSDGDLSSKVSYFVGDITKLEIDAIVNAANNSLLGGGGVDGAIHRAAGPLLLAENKTLDGCEDGEAKISCGYKLPARFVISTVGPRGEHPEVLRSAYSSCLSLMKENNLRSIAFPCISTGVYGYPQDSACCVALRTVRRFLEKHGDNVDRVIFCLFLSEDVALYRERMPIIFPSQRSEPEGGEGGDTSATTSPKEEETEEKVKEGEDLAKL